MQAHSLASNIVNEKARADLYIRHLAKVESISNREAKNLKQKLRQYQELVSPHKLYKLQSFSFNARRHSKAVELSNMRISLKIQSLKPSPDLLSVKRTRPNCLNSSNSDKAQLSKSTSAGKKKGLHYNYRKSRQQLIETENKRLMKAILSQKSTILPSIRDKLTH